ncbi:MAG: hypothetical protein AAFP79_04775 [Pseudomonadota bacterium]
MEHAASPTLASGSWLDPVNAALTRAPVWAFLVAIIVTLQLALIWSHQAWADEFQALLLATKASTQNELLAWLRYEGHPPAWYWFLRGLATALPVAIVLPAAATVCALVVHAVILFAAPFTRAERLLLASSQYVLFEFLTISRGTSLGVALILLALVAWRSRWLWLLMATLPLVDFMFGVVSGVFLILKWREGELWWPGVGVWLGGSALAGWTVLPAPDMVSAFDAMRGSQGAELLMESLNGWFLRMGSLPLPFQGGIAPQWNTPVNPISSFAWIAMVWLCWHLTQGFAWHRLMIFGFFGFTLAFTLVVYPIGLRHVMLGALLLFALVWLQRSSGRPCVTETSTTWKVWLIALAISGLATGAISTNRGFDAGAQVVSEIESRGLDNKRWIALPEWRVPAVSARSDIAFERLGENCRFTFVRWDHSYDALESNEALAAALKADIAANGRGYLLSDMEFIGFDPDLLSPLATVAAGYDGIPYNLYVIGRNSTEKPRTVPWCHSVNTASSSRGS